MFSILQGSLHFAALLLQSGADPNHEDPEKKTPLFYAVRRRDIHAVRLLLDFGANPGHPSPRSPTEPELTRLSILLAALRDCFYLGAAMLLGAWTGEALSDQEFGEALFAALHSHSRECVAVLLHDRQSRVFTTYKGKSIIYQAIDAMTPLLSLLAAYAKAAKTPEQALPPSDVKGGAKTKFNAALRAGDIPFPYDRIEQELSGVVSPWRRIETDRKSVV